MALKSKLFRFSMIKAKPYRTVLFFTPFLMLSTLIHSGWCHEPISFDTISEVKAPRMITKDGFEWSGSQNQAPLVVITTPADQSIIRIPEAITITAYVSDPDGSVTKVQFFSGATLLGESISTPYSYIWNTVQEGSYVLTVHAIDNEGTVTISDPVTITVYGQQNQFPVVSLTSPTDSQYVAPASIIISAEALDPDGVISRVEFYNGSTRLNQVLSSPYVFEWSNVAVGTYTITARAYDNDGLSTTSSPVVVSVELFNSRPVVSILVPENNAIFEPFETISLMASASDEDGSIVKVEFLSNGSLLGERTFSPYRFNWEHVDIGTYVITAKATDDMGGCTVSEPVTVRVFDPLAAGVVTYKRGHGTQAEAIYDLRGRSLHRTWGKPVGVSLNEHGVSGGVYIIKSDGFKRVMVHHD